MRREKFYIPGSNVSTSLQSIREEASLIFHIFS
jgi:hypothetical protein